MNQDALAFPRTLSADTQGFFLRNVLTARTELHLPTGCHGDNDEDANVYLAGLFDHLVADHGSESKPYLSPYDGDIRTYLDEHPGAANEYVVYRDNADFALMSKGVFQGDLHPGSYFHRVLSDTDTSGKIAFYYRSAAAALAHIKGSHTQLVHTFETLAEHVDDALAIVRKVAGDYFEFIHRISEGSIFHLERELTEFGRAKEYEQRLDDFLKHYAAYRRAPSVEGRLKIAKIVAELRELNPEFSFGENAELGMQNGE